VSFIQPPFWANQSAPATAPHAVSVVFLEPTLEPIDLATAKLYARLSATDTSLDTLIPGFIKTARSKVEQDTGLALLTQTRDVYLDAIAGRTLTLPSQSRPLQSVTSFKSTDTAGVVQTLDPSNYVVDLVGGRLGLALGGAWPSDLRPFQPYVLRIVAGWTTVPLLAAARPTLVDAVGFLVDYTINKDALALELYEEAIAPYRPVCVA